MSDTTVSASTKVEEEAAQMWAKEYWLEVRRPGFWGQFMGVGKNNIIQVKEDFIKNKGDRLNFTLIKNLSNAPIHGDGWVEDNEEALSTYQDSVLLDEISHAVRPKGKLTEQRAHFNLRQACKDALSYWFNEQHDTILFKKLSGETFQAYPGTSRGTPGSLETAFESATTNTNIIYGGDATATSDIDESDTMTLEMLDDAKTCAEVGVIGSSTIYKIDPVMIKGKKFFCCVMHPYQWNSLKKTTDWKELMYQAEVRGKENPVFSGATGYYNGIFIYVHDLVRTASTWGAGSDVAGATALFLGASAGLYAKAQKNPDWVEQKFNYGKKLGVGTGYIMGFDKATFNSLDHAVIAIKTAAKNPRV